MQETGNNITKANIDLIDKDFDASQSGYCYLSIQIATGNLSFCVFNTVLSKYVVLRNFPLSGADQTTLTSECASIFENDDLLGLNYKSSCHLWTSPYFTFVPEELFDSDETDLFLKFNHGVVEGEKALQNHVKSANLHNVFSYPEKLAALFQSFQPNIAFLHHASLFAETIISRKPSSDNREIAVYYYSGYLDIMIIGSGKQLFYNTFKIDAPEDAVYYLMVISNSFEIDLKATKLIFPDVYEHIPPEIAILNTYVECIVECKPSTEFTYSQIILESFRKDYNNLFNLYRCEL